MKYEYRQEYAQDHGTKSLVDVLNKYGQEGWKTITVRYVEDGGWSAILERKIVEVVDDQANDEPMMKPDWISASEPDGFPRGWKLGSLKQAVSNVRGEVEKDLILKALEFTGGNVSKAAKVLETSRKNMQLKMIGYGIRDTEEG